MEDRKVDRLQTFFNDKSCEKTLEMYNVLDELKIKVESAGRSTAEIMKLIGMVADVLVETSSNANKIIDLTRALDEHQLRADKTNTEMMSWRTKYLNLLAKVDRRNKIDMGIDKESSSSKLDFNSKL